MSVFSAIPREAVSGTSMGKLKLARPDVEVIKKLKRQKKINNGDRELKKCRPEREREIRC